MQSTTQGIGMTSQRTRERLVQSLQGMGIHSVAVLDAIRNVPRHLFVDEALASRAYENTALPIGYQQTISQPYVVARIVQSLIENLPKRETCERPLHRILEIGTGCGYQTAILSKFASQVYSVERISPLLQQAGARFRTLGYTNVRTMHADGNQGYPRYAPYDGIVVSASCETVPPDLLEQLAAQGRLLIPVDQAHGTQTLLFITRTENGFNEQRLEDVRFVPMQRGLHS
ncbi:MAG: protein-L-isoaspartate(D-aspartate) O-methyltransferase [Candidatus Eutrophobiaceae bacterium]